MSLGSVGADSQDTPSITELIDGVGHSPAAKALAEPNYCRSMTKTGTVVDIVGAQYRPGKFLDDIVILVGALG